MRCIILELIEQIYSSKIDLYPIDYGSTEKDKTHGKFKLNLNEIHNCIQMFKHKQIY